LKNKLHGIAQYWAIPFFSKQKNLNKMKTIINFLKSIINRNKVSKYDCTNALKEALLNNAHKILDPSRYRDLIEAKNIKDIMKFLTENFVMVCTFKILTVEIIEQYVILFGMNKIHANSHVVDGYLLANHHYYASCDGHTIAVAIHNAKIHGYGRSEVIAHDTTHIELSDDAIGESHGYSTMVLKHRSQGVSYDHSRSILWDQCHLIAKDNSRILAISGGTYELQGNAKVETPKEIKE
jgi:hypothetical protein